MKFSSVKPIILASTSPRRKELLEILGLPFEVVPSHVVENNSAKGIEFVDYVRALAIAKTEAVAQNYPDAVVIGADTIVSFEKELFPKPKDNEEAKSFLRKLSGKTHSVITGVAISVGGRTYSFENTTKVTFFELDDRIIDAYVASGDPLDKAGAYGIQSGGALFVKEIKGDYYSVMGLPISALATYLRSLGILSLEGGGVKSDD